MRYIRVSDDLFLVAQDVVTKNTKEVQVPKGLNHIFIYDRSGSMYGVLDQLCEDLKARLRTVPTGDTVTLGWFSGEGDFNFCLKGFKVTGSSDYKTLDKVIDQNNTTRGCTCFSEILGDTNTVVRDLSALNNNFALVFFSDGYPVVSNYTKELQAIDKAIKAVSGKITSSLMVGYGNYYNKELMSDMASKFGGSLIHSSDLKSFPTVLQSFMEKARENESKVLVELHALPHADGAVFSLAGNQVNLFAVDQGSIAFSPTKGAVDTVFVLTNKAPRGMPDSNRQSELTEQWTKALYAAAYIMVQKTKTDVALDVLSVLGDKVVIDRVNNAFTNTEYGNAEANILEAIGRRESRFIGGQVQNYLPKPDAFCVLDALELLTEDPAAEFWPYNEAFEYKKIGVGSKTKDGYPKFEPDKNARVPLKDLVWNDTKLNLSVRARIPGTIDLPAKEAKAVRLEKTFETFVWRNYTVVKDGFLNVNSLPVSMSKETYDKLLAEDVIDKEHNRHYAGRVYVLHLDRLPVINRKIADGKTSAKQLAKNILEELAHEGRLKALNFMRNEVEPREDRGLGMTLTAEQEEFLKTQGVTRSGFNPPTEKLEATDFYMAKEFEVKVKGFSSFPKVEEVRNKLASKKPLTPSAELVAEGLKLGTVAEMQSSSNKVQLAKLDSLIESEKAGLKRVRSYIQRTKFAVLLAKKWFSEFNSREDNHLDVDGKDVSFSVREVKVEI